MRKHYGNFDNGLFHAADVPAFSMSAPSEARDIENQRLAGMPEYWIMFYVLADMRGTDLTSERTREIIGTTARFLMGHAAGRIVMQLENNQEIDPRNLDYLQRFVGFDSEDDVPRGALLGTYERRERFMALVSKATNMHWTMFDTLTSAYAPQDRVDMSDSGA